MIKRFILGVFVLTSSVIIAQRNSASPYSYFGIGESFEAVTVEQASMGGIGVAMKDYHHLNFTNPASNADLKAATYAIGGSLTFLTVKEQNASQTGNSTNLRYISLGFPVGKNAGLSIGLQPFSSVGYSLLNDENADNVTLFTGEGGANKIYASYGMYVYKGLSIGAEAGFIFGSIDNSVLNQRADVALATKHEESFNLRGGQFKLGIQYKTELKNKLQLSTGASFILSTDLSAKGSEKMYSLSFNGSGQEVPRNELFNRTLNGNISMPLKSIYGFGLGKENKWYVGINQEFQTALESNSVFIADGSSHKYEDSNKFAIGGYFIPKINSISSYWDRVTYRAGLRFEDTGLLVKTTDNFTSVKDFGINVGLGLPLPRQLSNVNIGFEYGQRGTTNNNLIKEDYFNVRLSLSLNSIKWFQKTRID
ncbi:membrane protein [Alteromonas sp. KUL156]|nr:membrane protein [Tenacibaculum mesophilum]GFD74059.1 membrane protein [Tenacibaculum sp. KUL113]GFD80788.1 membrane protein [Tenacibaculum sp. KUL118]GFD92034.1 membrane protein [Alteromonas sp. KUL154]GFE02628.1 membrane protein [Alteromonas sp. KUL156]